MWNLIWQRIHTVIKLDELVVSAGEMILAGCI